MPEYDRALDAHRPGRHDSATAEHIVYDLADRFDITAYERDIAAHLTAMGWRKDRTYGKSIEVEHPGDVTTHYAHKDTGRELADDLPSGRPEPVLTGHQRSMLANTMIANERRDKAVEDRAVKRALDAVMAGLRDATQLCDEAATVARKRDDDEADWRYGFGAWLLSRVAGHIQRNEANR